MTQPSLTDDFAIQVARQNPMHATFLNASLQGMDCDTRRHLEEYLTYCLASGLDIRYLVESYTTITIDTQTEQFYFIKYNKYRYSRFNEVAEKVYFDQGYMRKYMYGLALTSFLWPNHSAIHKFFIDTFPKGICGRYLEIGPGHGYYFMEAARLGNFDHMTGVDISPASVTLTRDILNYHGINKGRCVELIAADFLAHPASDERYSCIVMGEVLEHVESPAQFLRKIAEISGTETHIYVTSCVNAPAVDHIYLFRHPKQIECMADSVGLTITSKYYAPYSGTSIEKSLARALPVNVAYIMRKQ